MPQLVESRGGGRLISEKLASWCVVSNGSHLSVCKSTIEHGSQIPGVGLLAGKRVTHLFHPSYDSVDIQVVDGSRWGP